VNVKEFSTKPKYVVVSASDGMISCDSISPQSEHVDRWRGQPIVWSKKFRCVPIPHDFVQIKVMNGPFMFIDLYNTGIEIVFAQGNAAEQVALKRRGNGKMRQIARQCDSFKLAWDCKLGDILDWLDGKRQQPYCLFFNNCIHFANDLSSFLKDRRCLAE
jgi:hypothetical protein